MIKKDCTERLFAVALSIGLIIPPPNAFRVTWSERVFFFSQIRHGNALNEIAWEDAVQGVGMAMSTVASEKTDRELLFIGNVFYKQ